MRVGGPSVWQFLRRLTPSLFLSVLIVWLLWPHSKHKPLVQPTELELKYPLLWTHVHMSNGTGGGVCTTPRAYAFIRNN